MLCAPQNSTCVAHLCERGRGGLGACAQDRVSQEAASDPQSEEEGSSSV